MDELLTKCKEITETIKKRPDAEAFLEPVPWEAWGLDDYPKIIKQPMDLGTVSTKLTSGEYKDIYEYAYDMRLIWRNCCTYNQESADIYKIGKSLSEFFEYQFKEIELLVPKDMREPTVEIKRVFVDNLFRLSGDELAKVIEKLNERCESALDKSKPDLVDIIVDAIDNATFNYLDKFVTELVNAKSTQMEVEN